MARSQLPTHSLTAAGSTFHVLSIFFQEGIRVLSTYTFGLGDIVLSLLQPYDNLFCSLIGCLHVFSVEFGHNIV
jgi:hypothetical protein